MKHVLWPVSGQNHAGKLMWQSLRRCSMISLTMPVAGQIHAGNDVAIVTTVMHDDLVNGRPEKLDCSHRAIVCYCLLQR